MPASNLDRPTEPADIGDEDGEGGRAELVSGFSRGLAVIRCFSVNASALTIAEVAKAAGLNRSTARRLLRTLEAEGYVGLAGGRYSLRPRVLELGYAYLASVPVDQLLQQQLFEVAEKVHESCIAAVLDGHDAVFVARAQTTYPRVMKLALSVGTRIPAHRTASGRVLLAGLSDGELDDYLRTADFRHGTSREITDADVLREELGRVRAQGYCILDQEIEIGVRACAVPVPRSQQPPLAIGVSSHASVGTVQTVRREHLPVLKEAAVELDWVFRQQRT
ncbi:IclR family transcriptional regulator C-terminal domain-containing protein [Streptomyces sp. NPDC088747]|uniref:IclR family transcriptional regulator domain-containing protein n=1 Tax=Streptomyces sp. NPDC088747 TaxID=3365886 RepID=UPI00382EAA00